MADVKLQTAETFRTLLERVECKLETLDFEFVIRERNGDFSLQIQFDAFDNLLDKDGADVMTLDRQFCRIWPLQDTM